MVSASEKPLFMNAQLFETAFLLSYLSMICLGLWVTFKQKDYLFGIIKRDSTVSLAQVIALGDLINMVSLCYIPLASYLAITFGMAQANECKQGVLNLYKGDWKRALATSMAIGAALTIDVFFFQITNKLMFYLSIVF